MQEILIYSLVVSCISFTISEAAIFKKLRDRIKFHNRLLGKLVCCGYCVGHYIAALVMIIYQPRLFFYFAPVDYLFTWFVLVWISGVQWVIMVFLFKVAGK